MITDKLVAYNKLWGRPHNSDDHAYYNLIKSSVVAFLLFALAVIIGLDSRIISHSLYLDLYVGLMG